MPPRDLGKIDDIIPMPERSAEYRCDSCGRTLFVGVLGRGSNISVQCQRRRCNRHRTPPYCRIVVPAA
jgi:PHP family Zn ribbon phosphoesterase